MIPGIPTTSSEYTRSDPLSERVDKKNPIEKWMIEEGVKLKQLKSAKETTKKRYPQIFYYKSVRLLSALRERDLTSRSGTLSARKGQWTQCEHYDR